MYVCIASLDHGTDGAFSVANYIGRTLVSKQNRSLFQQAEVEGGVHFPRSYKNGGTRFAVVASLPCGGFLAFIFLSDSPLFVFDAS